MQFALMSEEVIRLPAFSANGECITGTLPLASLPRLCRQLPAAPSGELAYRLAGSRTPQGSLLLALEMSANLPLQCRRCLQVFTHPLTTRQTFWLSGSPPPPPDATAEAAEELEAEDTPLKDFLTDELLLSLPIAPVHTDAAACSVVVAA